MSSLSTRHAAKHQRVWLPRLMKLVAVTRGGNATGRTGIGEPLQPAALAVVEKVAPEKLDELECTSKKILRTRLDAEQTLRESDLWQMWCMLLFAMQDGDIEMFEKLCNVQPRREL